MQSVGCLLRNRGSSYLPTDFLLLLLGGGGRCVRNAIRNNIIIGFSVSTVIYRVCNCRIYQCRAAVRSVHRPIPKRPNAHSPSFGRLFNGIDLIRHVADSIQQCVFSLHNPIHVTPSLHTCAAIARVD